jgi:uncharacterized oligopeptide transporter (OPT) family protein
LNKTYGFTGEGALVAPQANAMAAVIDPLMSGTGAPWLLYGIGALISIVLTFCGVPALAFALGMFIPLSLNVPLLVGGLVAWFVSNRSKDTALNTARQEKGTLIASGFIAGGALMGVVSAILKFSGLHLTIPFGTKQVLDATTNQMAEKIVYWHSTASGEWLSLAMYAVLIAFFVWYVLKDRK